MIWVISPDPDTQRLIRLNLTKRGYQVAEACPEAELGYAVGAPQLIILDVDVADEAGWEVAQKLRRSSDLCKVPIILLLASAPSAKRLTPLRPVRWLEKPLAVDALLSLVQQSLYQEAP